jgi:hypothetical protein
MFPLKPTAVALASLVLLAPAARAQTNAELLTELRALKARVGELERKLSEATAQKPEWGMTPDQVRDFNRIAVKTEGVEDAIEAQGLKMLKISGFMDPAYVWNQHQHRAGFQFLNPVALDGYNYDNSYFGSATIDFQKEMEGGTKFRLTLTPNRGTGSVIGENSIVQEASVMVPLGDLQTRFLAGQIPDWSGYEYQQATLNKLITHNLLYDFTLPTTYTGAGMEYVRGKWDTKWLLANMNASKRGAGEKSPVLALRVDYSRGEYQGFGFAGVYGKALNWRAAGQTNPVSMLPYSQKDSRVGLFEADAYFIRGDLTWQGQLSFGMQKGAAISADPVTGDLRDATWTGASTLLAYKFIPRWEAVARLDLVHNTKNGGGLLTYGFGDGRNGIGPDGNLACDPTLAGNAAECDKGTNRMALSLGLSWVYNLNTTFKAEYRIDRASLPVFLDATSQTYGKTNQLLGTSVVVSF